MMRSQTDAMLAARHDPKPYEFEGNRAKHADVFYPNVPTFTPRVEMIPVVAPVAVYADGRKLVTFHARPPVNPILVEFRQALDWSGWVSTEAAGFWEWEDEYAPEQIDHARKVLTRLAALS